MGKQRFAALLLLMTLSLSGCGAPAPSGSGDESQPPAQSEQSAGSANSSEDVSSASAGEGDRSQQEEVPDEVLYLDDPESPYPMAVEGWDLDVDGDGQAERIELWAEKAYWGNETDNDWHEGEGMRPYSLRLIRNGEAEVCPLGWQPEEEPSHRPYYWSARPAWTQDQEGQDVLVLSMENMSAGGAGSIDLYAFLAAGEVSQLPVPERYTLVTDQSDLYALLTVPETGYNEELDLAQWMIQRNVEPLYDELGEEIQWPVAPQMIDGFYSAEAIEGGVRLRQYCWGVAHVDGMCDLVTDLSWSGGEAMVLQQYFDWYN